MNSGETYKRRISRPFNRNTHFVTISKNSTEQNISDFIRDCFQPDQIYGIYFNDETLRPPFFELFKTVFNYSVKVYISNINCKDIIDTDIQKNIVDEYHQDTHNGINETYNKIKDKFFWPNLKNTVSQIIIITAKYASNLNTNVIPIN